MSFVPIAATSQSIEIHILDDDGLPVTGLVAATFPDVYYQRTREAPVQITPLVDLALQTTAWTTKGVKELTGGRYRLDVPDAAFATAAKVTIIGEASGKRIIYPTIDCGLDLTSTTVGAVTELSAAQAEPGQGAPAVNASPLTKLAYLFKGWRNKKLQTATQFSLLADDATTVDQKATVSDDGTTTTIGEVATGP